MAYRRILYQTIDIRQPQPGPQHVEIKICFIPRKIKSRNLRQWQVGQFTVLGPHVPAQDFRTQRYRHSTSRALHFIQTHTLPNWCSDFDHYVKSLMQLQCCIVPTLSPPSPSIAHPLRRSITGYQSCWPCRRKSAQISAMVLPSRAARIVEPARAFRDYSCHLLA